MLLELNRNSNAFYTHFLPSKWQLNQFSSSVKKFLRWKTFMFVGFSHPITTFWGKSLSFGAFPPHLHSMSFRDWKISNDLQILYIINIYMNVCMNHLDRLLSWLFNCGRGNFKKNLNATRYFKNYPL